MQLCQSAFFSGSVNERTDQNLETTSVTIELSVGGTSNVGESTVGELVPTGVAGRSSGLVDLCVVGMMDAGRGSESDSSRRDGEGCRRGRGEMRLTIRVVVLKRQSTVRAPEEWQMTKRRSTHMNGHVPHVLQGCTTLDRRRVLTTDDRLLLDPGESLEDLAYTPLQVEGAEMDSLHNALLDQTSNHLDR
jgi:hypothetical protein